MSLHDIRDRTELATIPRIQELERSGPFDHARSDLLKDEFVALARQFELFWRSDYPQTGNGRTELVNKFTFTAGTGFVLMPEDIHCIFFASEELSLHPQMCGKAFELRTCQA